MSNHSIVYTALGKTNCRYLKHYPEKGTEFFIDELGDIFRITNPELLTENYSTLIIPHEYASLAWTSDSDYINEFTYMKNDHIRSQYQLAVDNYRKLHEPKKKPLPINLDGDFNKPSEYRHRYDDLSLVPVIEMPDHLYLKEERRGDELSKILENKIAPNYATVSSPVRMFYLERQIVEAYKTNKEDDPVIYVPGYHLNRYMADASCYVPAIDSEEDAIAEAFAKALDNANLANQTQTAHSYILNFKRLSDLYEIHIGTKQFTVKQLTNDRSFFVRLINAIPSLGWVCAFVTTGQVTFFNAPLQLPLESIADTCLLISRDEEGSYRVFGTLFGERKDYHLCKEIQGTTERIKGSVHPAVDIAKLIMLRSDIKHDKLVTYEERPTTLTVKLEEDDIPRQNQVVNKIKDLFLNLDNRFNSRAEVFPVANESVHVLFKNNKAADEFEADYHFNLSYPVHKSIRVIEQCVMDNQLPDVAVLRLKDETLKLLLALPAGNTTHSAVVTKVKHLIGDINPRGVGYINFIQDDNGVVVSLGNERCANEFLKAFYISNRDEQDNQIPHKAIVVINALLISLKDVKKVTTSGMYLSTYVTFNYGTPDYMFDVIKDELQQSVPDALKFVDISYHGDNRVRIKFASPNDADRFLKAYREPRAESKVIDIPSPGILQSGMTVMEPGIQQSLPSHMNSAFTQDAPNAPDEFKGTARVKL